MTVSQRELPGLIKAIKRFLAKLGGANWRASLDEGDAIRRMIEAPAVRSPLDSEYYRRPDTVLASDLNDRLKASLLAIHAELHSGQFARDVLAKERLLVSLGGFLANAHRAERKGKRIVGRPLAKAKHAAVRAEVNAGESRERVAKKHGYKSVSMISKIMAKIPAAKKSKNG